MRFLIGINLFGKLRWSNYIYDAWRTRRIEDALLVAKKTSGEIILFNSANGDRQMFIERGNMKKITGDFKHKECYNCRDCILKVEKISGGTVVSCKNAKICTKQFPKDEESEK